MLSKWFNLVQDARMSYSPHIMSHEMNITLYQRTLLGTSANQKRHYLKSYNNIVLMGNVFDFTLTAIVQCHGQWVDTENTLWLYHKGKCIN